MRHHSQPVLPISRPAFATAKAVSDQMAEPTPADLERGGYARSGLLPQMSLECQ